MRLSSLSQEILPTALVDALRTLGIVSDADLFFSATPLEVWRKLPPGLMSLSEFERRVKAVMIQCAVPGFVATEAGGRPAPDQVKPGITTGVDNLDNLLGATLRESVVEISGRHGSGAAVRSHFLPCSIFRLKHFCLGANSKTLALQVACSHLASYPNMTALWIDTTGDFSPTKADITLRSMEPREVRVPTEASGW